MDICSTTAWDAKQSVTPYKPGLLSVYCWLGYLLWIFFIVFCVFIIKKLLYCLFVCLLHIYKSYPYRFYCVHRATGSSDYEISNYVRFFNSRYNHCHFLHKFYDYLSGTGYITFRLHWLGSSHRSDGQYSDSQYSDR